MRGENLKTNLFHDSSLAFRESGVAPQFIVDKLHFDFNTAFSFLSIRGWIFLWFRFISTIIIVVIVIIIIIIIIIVVVMMRMVVDGRTSISRPIIVVA